MGTMRVAKSGPHAGNRVATLFASPIAMPACTRVSVVDDIPGEENIMQRRRGVSQ